MCSVFSSTNKKWQGSLRVYFKKGKYVIVWDKGQAHSSHLINVALGFLHKNHPYKIKQGLQSASYLGQGFLSALFTAFILSAQNNIRHILRFNKCFQMQGESFKYFAIEYICCKLFWRFSSVAQSCLTLCDPMDCSTPSFPVHRQLPELAQTHVHRVSDAIQPSHPLSSPSPPAFSLSQHQSLFK